MQLPGTRGWQAHQWGTRNRLKKVKLWIVGLLDFGKERDQSRMIQLTCDPVSCADWAQIIELDTWPLKLSLELHSSYGMWGGGRADKYWTKLTPGTFFMFGCSKDDICYLLSVTGPTLQLGMSVLGWCYQRQGRRLEPDCQALGAGEVPLGDSLCPWNEDLALQGDDRLDFSPSWSASHPDQAGWTQEFLQKRPIP